MSQRLSVGKGRMRGERSETFYRTIQKGRLKERKDSAVSGMDIWADGDVINQNGEYRRKGRFVREGNIVMRGKTPVENNKRNSE